ncbi:MAG: DNA replication/repair protein RecF [Clostridia bacterium]|nr:DNA replication/repair protein RecF [Clostridia bacterium]
MFITEIQLKNFRNYHDLLIYPQKDINLIYGKNAQGKTNLIESVYLASTGRSHRAIKENQLIKEGENGYLIKIKGIKDDIPFSLEIKYIKGEKRQIKINGLLVSKLGEMIGVLNTVIFSPEDLQIIKQGPSERRRFIDILISQTSSTYFYKLQKLNRIIKQKNAVLKKYQHKELTDLLDVYNNKLEDISYEIIKERVKFLEETEKHFNIFIKKLSNNNETGEIKYISSLGFTREEIKKNIHNNIKNEIKNKMTLYGPHRDDFTIFINDKDVKFFGSQGQQRTSVLALKLSEIEIIKEKTGYFPVLLLDDVMSELDLSRRKFLTESILTRQTFITSTEKKNYSQFLDKTTFYHVSQGIVEQR